MRKDNNHFPDLVRRYWFFGMALAFALAGLLSWNQVAQAEKSARESTQLSPIHPAFALLDENEENVLESDGPISTMKTCGQCHETEFIAEHSYHASAGTDDLSAPDMSGSSRPWDISNGYFGKWNPIGYRYLSPGGDERIDLTTPEWLQLYGIRHVGGGPAVYSQNGKPLTELSSKTITPENSILDPKTGELVFWNWKKSGTIEMNCFLCHTPAPNTKARNQEIQSGNFRWANTATLVGTGLVEASNKNYAWNPLAFNPDGELKDEYLFIQDPGNNNCGLCHGLVHDNVDDPVATTGCVPERWSTITTGQIISPQRLSDSGMNLANKDSLSRTWDVHAERLLNCTDCHYSLNNPLYYQERGGSQPDHLKFDPRRLDIGEYLQKPLHQFARGESAQGTIAPELKDTMRRCDSCHDSDKTHGWLPYQERHMEILSCESCHVPRLYSSANMQHDWTVLTLEGSATTQCRGAEGDVSKVATLLTGYEPTLLPRQDVDGNISLTPHNLVTTWFWIYGDPQRPVPIRDLEAAYFENGDYHPQVIIGFDQDQDGEINESELVINTLEKEQVIKERLESLGIENPRIKGEVQPYTINHNIAEGEWVLKDCRICHSEESRLTASIQIAPYLPGGEMPEFVSDTNVRYNGNMYLSENGALFYEPDTEAEELYIFGLTNVGWIDLLGSLMFLGVLLGISVHGGLRLFTSRGNKTSAGKTKRVYMYGFYERLWHWLQTFSIVLLLFTGLIIHKPDTFGIFNFNGVVITHNVLAVILAINAVFALFYHLASGEIKQYLPEPKGFFSQAISQAMYYLRGIFKREAHPFEKNPNQKMNPLQQVTYLAILNILLPLQGITGILMWGVQRWPQAAGSLGGLPFLAPFHTLVAWTFAAFIVLHVYLTTTGHTPLAAIQAMIVGWEDLEVDHLQSKEDPEA